MNNLMIPMDPDEYDSLDEYQFALWCVEAVHHDVIGRAGYHPNTVEIFPRASVTETKQLKTKTKEVDTFLFHPLSYTADFILFGPMNVYKRLGLRHTHGLLWIDVKGSFSKFHDDKSFSMVQKMMWHLKGVYVNKVELSKFFRATWCPSLVRVGKSGKELKKWKGCPTVQDFIKG